MVTSCTFRKIVKIDKKYSKIEETKKIKDLDARKLEIIKIEAEPAQYKTELQKCNSRYNIKVIEFKHPDYPELSEWEYLCDSHFTEVFGDIKNEEQLAYRNWRSQVFIYKKDFAKAQKFAEYFNPNDFKNQNYNKVENRKILFDNIKRKVCRYEYCAQNLDSIRKIYRIIVSRMGGIDFKSYFFCGKPHWVKIKLRIQPKLESKKSVITNVKSLLEFT